MFRSPTASPPVQCFRTSARRCLALVVVLLLAGAAAAHAQGRTAVLVPPLVVGSGAAEAGEEIARSFRARLDGFPTHVAVPEARYREALRGLGAGVVTLDCVQNRQVAAALEIPLVVCGVVERVGGGLSVAARFVDVPTGEAFVVDAVEVADTAAAAEHMAGAFMGYIQYRRAVELCADALASRRYQDALAQCDRALASHPGSEAARYHKARALLALGRYEESLDEHAAVVAANPRHGDALVTAGVVALRLGDRDLARSYFAQGIDLDPDNVSRRLEVAGVADAQGDGEGALRMVEEGLARAPDDLELLRHAGHFAMRAARELQPAGGEAGIETAGPETLPPAAVAHLEKALEYYNRVFGTLGAERADPSVLREMMLALTLLGRPADAIALGRRAVEAHPADADLWSQQAEALRRSGRLDDALAALDSLLALDPAHPRLHFRRGELLVQSRRLREAVAELQMAVLRREVSRDRASQAVLAFAADSLYDAGEHEAAYEYFAAARQLADSPVQRGGPAFFMGVIEYRRGVAASGPAGSGTPASARQALQHFRRAFELLSEGGPWVTHQSADLQQRYAQYIDAARRSMEYQQAILDAAR